jgi:hypothetical protein
VKLLHSLKSYQTWEKYRNDLGLGDGGTMIQAGRQHRLYGASWPWGGCEYWGLQTQLQELERFQWSPGATPSQILEMLKADTLIGYPGDHSLMTDWSDVALNRLGVRLTAAGMSLIDMLRDLVTDGARVTRLDISADFPGAVIEPVEAARLKMDYLPFRVSDFHDSRQRGPTGGWTCYFGSRGKDGSGKFVRVYEKGKESALGYDMLRVEAELRDHHARQALRRMVSPEIAWESEAASIIAGIIDFREGYGSMRGSQNAARDTERYAWWESILARLNDAVKLKAEKKDPKSLHAKEEWARKAWPKTVAMLAAWRGESKLFAFFHDLLKQGYEQMTERDWAEVRLALVE